MKARTQLLQAIHGKNVDTQKRLIKQELDKFKAALKLEIFSPSRDIRGMLACIHEHLFDPALKVFEVRRRCGVRNNNISTYFKDALGMGIREYIEDKRIRAAMQLLAHADLEIFLIGLGVGYSHEESFTRAFRRRLGCTPSEYRKGISEKKC